MRLPLDREWAWGIVAVVATTALWLGDPGSAITKAREAAFEAMGQLFPRASSSGSVTVIDIDRESLSRIGPWPWRRSLIAGLVQQAGDQAASPRPWPDPAQAFTVDIDDGHRSG